MSVFNSLGSNYNLSFALRTLRAKETKKQLLLPYLEQRYRGKGILFSKGREAISFGLSLLQLAKGTHVGITGYTCIAVYAAVINAGYIPVYFDIDADTLNFTAQTLSKAVQKDPLLKVILIQNTLGLTNDIEDIEKVCRKHDIIIIEDLAHSAGAMYANGKEAGCVGDLTALSFSQDKMIDGITGGALLIRNRQYQQTASATLAPLSKKQQMIDRWYPLATYCIRTTYNLFLGKLLHMFLRNMHLLSQPVNIHTPFLLHNLPSWYERGIYEAYEKLPANLKHRRNIAKVYATTLFGQFLLKDIEKKIQQSANLRFPILTENRSGLISYLRTHQIYVSDIWYDSPVAPKRYQATTTYAHQCPAAEYVSDHMLNLPTHRNISERKAREIAERINAWQSGQ